MLLNKGEATLMDMSNVKTYTKKVKRDGMNEQAEKIQERRSTRNQLIEHLLNERHQLLSLLLEVSSSDSSQQTTFEEFLQILVDYVAAGHFGLYERIIEGKERRKAILKLASEIYPHIEKTTEVALTFDEEFNSQDKVIKQEDFQEKLSSLGEALTTRIELEDKLIELMLETKQ